MKNKEIFESIEKELKRIAEENGHTNYYKNCSTSILVTPGHIKKIM